VLPTLQPHAAAANAVPRVEFTRKETTKPVFVQTLYRPPPARCDRRPRPDLSTAFAPAHAANPAAAPSKNPFGRKRPIAGQLRSYKVRMIPTEEQARELKRCFSAARHAYNATVAAVRGGARVNLVELRKAYRASPNKPAWTTGVNSKIIAGAVDQAVNAYKTNFAKLRQNPGHHFEVHFRSHRKAKTEVLRVEGDGEQTAKNSPLMCFKPVPFANNAALRSECLAFFGNNLKDTGGIRLQDKQHVVERLLAEGARLKETCRIHWEKRTNQFYFIYVYDLPSRPDPDPQFETKRLVATDPGVRDFQVWYSPTSGEHGTLFFGGGRQLVKRCFAIDRQTSRVAKRNNAERSDADNPVHAQRRTPKQRESTFRRMEHKLARDRLRLHNWMACGHYAAANFLLGRFDVVVAPRLRTGQLVPRSGRVFGSRTARSMLTWSHSLFEQRLHSAAFRYAGRHVISDSGEPGTSKTCAHCGHWHAALGASSIFVCPSCGVEMNRDVAGARNNFFAAYGRARGIGWDGIAH
jgi:transposase